MGSQRLATTVLNANGTYAHGVLPIPGKIVTSVAVPKGQMVAGVARNYFMAIGSGQKIEYSDHYKFLEDERTYLTKQYANGKPKDNDSFLLFDISNLNPNLNIFNQPSTVATAEVAVASTRAKK